MSFEDAIRVMADAPADAIVQCEITGGGSVQIGDYTWDDVAISIDITVLDKEYKQLYSNEFASLPELWEALGL